MARGEAQGLVEPFAGDCLEDDLNRGRWACPLSR